MPACASLTACRAYAACSPRTTCRRFAQETLPLRVGIIALSRPLGTRGVRAACGHAARYPELPSDAVRSRATSNRRSDDCVAHAVGVQSMSARRGQRRTRTAEYDSFSVADDSARPGAELPVNRRSPLSCSKTFESRWFLFATRQPSSPVAQVDALASRPDEGHSSPAQGEEPGCSPAFGDRNAGRPASVGTHSTLDCGYCGSLHAMAETSRRPTVLSRYDKPGSVPSSHSLNASALLRGS